MDLLERLQTALAERYRIERELGRGGMATVYLAEDLKHGRRVALKVLRPELAATLGAERFPREIAVAARLQHPHILALHDSGEAGGILYYAMPYVEGESLRARLAREVQLDGGRGRADLGEMAEALGRRAWGGGHPSGHQAGKRDAPGRHAMVMDFGVARR